MACIVIMVSKDCSGVSRALICSCWGLLQLQESVLLCFSKCYSSSFICETRTDFAFILKTLIAVVLLLL